MNYETINRNRVFIKFREELKEKKDTKSIINALNKLNTLYSAKSSFGLSDKNADELIEFVDYIRRTYVDEELDNAFADTWGQEPYIFILADELELDKISKELKHDGNTEAESLADTIWALDKTRLITVLCDNSAPFSFEIPETADIPKEDKDIYKGSLYELCKLLIYYGGVMIIRCPYIGINEKHITDVYGVDSGNRKWESFHTEYLKQVIEEERIPNVHYKKLIKGRKKADIININKS